MLEFGEPPTTAYFLIRIAQEEFAKAFILLLVTHGVVPWNKHILRATRDHKCKQLICVIMEWINPDTDWFLSRCNNDALRHELFEFTPKVADAINILRYEKIGRWVANNWFWAEDPDYDHDAKNIAKGKEDKKKQDLLYVRLASDGGIANKPIKTNSFKFDEEKDRARRFAQLVEDISNDKSKKDRNYEKVKEMFRLLFTE